jgi:N-acetylglucosamine-6-phosphate deacetylase
MGMKGQSVLWINADLYTPWEHIPNGRLLVMPDGRVGAVGGEEIEAPEGAEIADVKGCKLIPGFVDIHVHGGGGFDAMEGEDDLLGMSRYHAMFGTTSYAATTMTAPPEKLVHSLQSMKHLAESDWNGKTGAQMIGIHLEGPYLNRVRGGAQNPDLLRTPDTVEIERFLEAAGGWIRLVTIAPELHGAEDSIRLLHSQKITVSAGHTDALFAEMEQAITWGVSHTTHHYNGMRPFHSREAGATGAGLLLPELTIELIADGFHVSPPAIQMAFLLKGTERIALITDAVHCAGCPDGDYESEGLPIRMEGGKVMLSDGSSLAGSTLNMLRALMNALQMTGLPLERVLPSATAVPARQVGLQDRKGNLRTGYDADFVLIDNEWQVRATYVKGTKVYG